MNDLPQTKCKDCSTPIFMIENDRNGKRAPIDVEPVPDGDILIDHWESGEPFFHLLETGESAAGATRYMRHSETCAGRKRGKR